MLGGYVMNNTFRKATAIIITAFMMVSLSSCSNSGFSLFNPLNTSTTESEHSKSTNNDIAENDDNNVESIESKYNRGIKTLETGKFSEAQALFEECGNYEYALDLVNVCKAENEFSNGNFSNAAALYSTVSEKVEVPGFNVQQKKKNISARISLAKLSGTYYPSSNTITMVKYKKKRKLGGWHSVGIWRPQFITLSYTENANGTFNVTGYVQFMRYTNYSKKKSGIKSGIYKLPLNLKQVTRFPNSIKLAKGVSLTYKNGRFIVNYKKTTKKGKTKVVYKSNVTYRKY